MDFSAHVSYIFLCNSLINGRNFPVVKNFFLENTEKSRPGGFHTTGGVPLTRGMSIPHHRGRRKKKIIQGNSFDLLRRDIVKHKQNKRKNPGT